MGGSASQNLQAMAPLGLMQYTVVIATPRLCPDHRTTSTDQVKGEQENLSCCFCHLCPVSPPSPVSFNSYRGVMSRVDVLCVFILSKQRQQSLFPFM